jgi:L-fuculose-phosphate aldolase
MNRFGNENQCRKDLAGICNKMYKLGWAFNQGGCISIRISEDTFLYNPIHSKDLVSESDLVTMNMDGQKVGGDLEPDSGELLHIGIYGNREDVRAVVHAHPPYSTVYSLQNRPMDKCIFTDQILSLGSVPVVEYGSPGSKEIPDNLIKYLPNNNAFLLANHGAVTVGKDIYEAWDRMECLELTSQVYLFSKLLNKVDAISEENVKKIIKIRKDENFDDHYTKCKIETG